MPSSTSKQQLKAAKAALDSKAYAEVLSLTAALLAADPSSYNAHVLRGVALAATGDLSAAVASYSSATALRPDAPLAHKGIIDAVSPNDPLPAHRLALARALMAIPNANWEQGGRLFYELALEDSELLPEAADALRKARMAVKGQAKRMVEWAALLAWREVRLRSRALPESGSEKELALEEAPLSDALDELELFLREGAIAPCDEVADLVFARVVARCVRGEGLEEGLAFLRCVGADEALLEVAETARGVVIAAEDVVRAGMRGVHARPWRGEGRARFVVAAELSREPGGMEVAGQLVGVRVVSRGTGKGDRDITSGIQAIVKGLLHLKRGENKLALEAARKGQRWTEEAGKRERQESVLGLVAAAALAGDRKYKDAIREYAKVRSYAQREDDEWIEAAANRGLVDTSVVAHGRKSRQTSMAVEEAAGSAANIYGLLECAWTDALADDVDSDRMAELTSRAVKKAKGTNDAQKPLVWECKVLHPLFGISDEEMAAVASSRLGQMLMFQYGATEEVLSNAQKCQMEAASLFRGLPNPFAHLGYIFERLADLNRDQKMHMRALRCYEKAVSIDASHPLASRRLARILTQRGFVERAAEIARQASDRNPKARWAHNVVGWRRISNQQYMEAAVSFRNALRGRPKLSARAEEALFGTNVGKTDNDNALVVDVDSWRGLSAAYKGQGKIGPAAACVDDAISLIRNPPPMYTLGVDINVDALQRSLAVLLQSERSMLLQLQRDTSTAVIEMKSALQDSSAPPIVQSYLSEAYVDAAAELWLSGCYHSATLLRVKAAETSAQAAFELSQTQPHLNPSNLLKRLGDTQLEIATHAPELLKGLVSIETIDRSLCNALTSYGKALHFSPWDRTARSQDLATALVRIARFTADESSARKAVELLLATDPDPPILAMAVMQLASNASSERVMKTTNQLAHRVSLLTKSKSHMVALDASIAIHGAEVGGTPAAAESAVSAIRRDPSDWRGWCAVAAVRECDASKNDWPLELIKSSGDAYAEADRLGAGPFAVHGIARCLEALLRRREKFGLDAADVYRKASHYLSTASRIGLDESSLCRGIVDAHLSQVETMAKALTEEISQGGAHVDLYKHVHMYPYLREVANLELVAS